MLAVSGRVWHLRSFSSQQAAKHARMGRKAKGLDLAKLAPLVAQYKSKARYYADLEAWCGTETNEGGIIFIQGVPVLGYDASRHLIIMDWENRLGPYYAGLRRKYERAAAMPWLPVDPDSPRPKP